MMKNSSILNVTKASIRGQCYSQETLPENLSHKFAGQPLIWQLFSSCVGLSLSLIAGISSAFISVYIAISILKPQETFQKDILLLTLVSIVVLAILTSLKDLKYALQRQALFFVATSVILDLATSSEQPFNILLRSIAYHLFVSLFCLISLVSHIFSNSIFFVVIRQNKFLVIISSLNFLFFCTVLFFSINVFSQNDALELGVTLTNAELFIVKTFASTYSLLVIFFACFLSRGLNSINQKFKYLHGYSLIIGSLGGTSFYRLDLSYKDFTGSRLANTDLRAQKFHRTCLYHVSGLEKSILNNQYFDITDFKVQQLLTKGFSKEKDFKKSNLHGAYLHDSDLSYKNFTGASLAGAKLTHSSLRGCCLAHADLTGADLAGADLTGACIDNWSINKDTNLNSILCDFFYRQVDLETGEFLCRCPINEGESLKPGDFEALVQRQNETIELIFQDGIDWQAFFHSFQQLCQYYNDKAITIQAIEHQRQGSSIVRLDADEASLEERALIEQSAKRFYDKNIEMLEAQIDDYRILLQFEVERNSQLLTVVETMAEKQGHTFNFNRDVGNVNASEVKVTGNQVGIQNAFAKEQSLTEILQEIQQLWDVFKLQHPTSGQEKFAEELAQRGQKDKKFRQKLSKIGKSLVSSSSEEAAKVVGGQLASQVIPKALSLLAGLM